MTGLRERNKDKRRAAILDAALDLLDVGDIGKLTLEQVAAEAEVSPATIWNLVGTRDDLFRALIDAALGQLRERLDRIEIDDPIARAEAAINESVALFVGRAAAYRQIIGHLSEWDQLRETEHPVTIQIDAMQAAIDGGLLRADLTAKQLGWMVYTHFYGAQFAWAIGRVSDNAFKRRSLEGLYIVLAGAAQPRHRSRFIALVARQWKDR